MTDDKKNKEKPDMGRMLREKEDKYALAVAAGEATWDKEPNFVAQIRAEIYGEPSQEVKQYADHQRYLARQLYPVVDTRE